VTVPPSLCSIQNPLRKKSMHVSPPCTHIHCEAGRCSCDSVIQYKCVRDDRTCWTVDQLACMTRDRSKGFAHGCCPVPTGIWEPAINLYLLCSLNSWQGLGDGRQEHEISFFFHQFHTWAQLPLQHYIHCLNI
jgi:hypothetical protein